MFGGITGFSASVGECGTNTVSWFFICLFGMGPMFYTFDYLLEHRCANNPRKYRQISQDFGIFHLYQVCYDTLPFMSLVAYSLFWSWDLTDSTTRTSDTYVIAVGFLNLFLNYSFFMTETITRNFPNYVGGWKNSPMNLIFFNVENVFVYVLFYR
eukprot:UN02650